MLLVVAGFSMKTTSNTAQELSSSFLSLQMRLFIFGYFMHWLSTALSYKGCIINLIVCISCSFTCNMRCPFLTLQEAFRQIYICMHHVIVMTRKSKFRRYYVFSYFECYSRKTNNYIFT